MKILIVATCQGQSIQQVLEARSQHAVTRMKMTFIDTPESHAKSTPEYFKGFDVVIAQRVRADLTGLWDAIRTHPNVIMLPMFTFTGFHPDLLNPPLAAKSPVPPLVNVSRVMLSAWRRGGVEAWRRGGVEAWTNTKANPRTIQS